MTEYQLEIDATAMYICTQNLRAPDPFPTTPPFPHLLPHFPSLISQLRIYPANTAEATNDNRLALKT